MLAWVERKQGVSGGPQAAVTIMHTCGTHPCLHPRPWHKSRRSLHSPVPSLRTLHPTLQVWITAGCGLAAVLAQLAWMVAAHRKDARLATALGVAGVCDERQPELQEALLSGGSAAVREYLEP